MSPILLKMFTLYITTLFTFIVILAYFKKRVNGAKINMQCILNHQSPSRHTSASSRLHINKFDVAMAIHKRLNNKLWPLANWTISLRSRVENDKNLDS